jgi:hypothetical protein
VGLGIEEKKTKIVNGILCSECKLFTTYISLHDIINVRVVQRLKQNQTSKTL